MRQATLQNICEKVVGDLDGALACAIVEVSTGLPIALDVKKGALISAADMELISATGVTYFRDSAQIQGSTIANDNRFGHSNNYVQEIQAATTKTYNFWALVPGEEQELLILITDRTSSNLGLGWMALRHALEQFQNANRSDAIENQTDKEPRSTTRQMTPQQPLGEYHGLKRRNAHRRRAVWRRR